MVIINAKKNIPTGHQDFNMTTHAMIDIETLGTEPGCVVLSVGAVKFDPFNSETPHAPMLWKLDIDSQSNKGRIIRDDTIEWWGKQDAHVQEAAFSIDDRVTVEDFMKELNKWVNGVEKIWCQGPQFDMVILENLYEQYEHHHNWAFWQIMDCRTIFNMLPVDPRKAIQENLHDALADAHWQAVCVQQTYKHFTVLKR